MKTITVKQMLDKAEEIYIEWSKSQLTLEQFAAKYEIDTNIANGIIALGTATYVNNSIEFH